MLTEIFMMSKSTLFKIMEFIIFMVKVLLPIFDLKFFVFEFALSRFDLLAIILEYGLKFFPVSANNAHVVLGLAKEEVGGPEADARGRSEN